MLIGGLRYYYFLRHQWHQSHPAVMSSLCDISSSVLVGNTSVFVFRCDSMRVVARWILFSAVFSLIILGDPVGD